MTSIAVLLGWVAGGQISGTLEKRLVSDIQGEAATLGRLRFVRAGLGAQGTT